MKLTIKLRDDDDKPITLSETSRMRKEKSVASDHGGLYTAFIKTESQPLL